MKLNLPKQSTPAADAIPNHPRKLKKVLEALPNTNMGELTKQTYKILRDLNRQTMPGNHRLEDMEMIRPLARDIFNNLKKYFINRTLPLPEKSQKIVKLNQSILHELIVGYEIIASETANNTQNKVDNKSLAIAICRAINYLSETFLRASEVYASCPKDLWFESHQLYLLAEGKNIIDIEVSNIENKLEKTTIANSYKQLLLFSLARPIALRQSDSQRVYNELFNWAQFSTISPDANKSQIESVFCIHVNADHAPNYLNEHDFSSGSELRILEASKLVTKIKDIITERNKEKQKIAVGDTIPLETLITLVNSWGVNVKRRFSRANKDDDITVAIGLSQIAKIIKLSLQDDEDLKSLTGFAAPPAVTKQAPEFTLETLTTENTEPNFQGYTTHTQVNSEQDNTWDMVSKGRALTDTYAKEQKKILDEKLKLRRQNFDSHWKIVNISAGGYCLRWDSDDTSKAQIGELIALREPLNNNHEWRIGVIRWMQFTQENGLEIGVQILSPKVSMAKVRRVNRPKDPAYDCIMLPGIKALKQAANTILPSLAFNTGDKLVVQISEDRTYITLGETKEHTGSFTQFTYKKTEEDQLRKKQLEKEEAIKKKDDFDELWSSL